MRSHLLNDATAESYRRSVTEGVERVANRLATTRQPFTGVTAEELAPVIADIDLDRPLGDSSAALDELEQVYLRDAVYFHHPRYLGHLNCPVVIPAVLGEAVLSAVNSSLDTWDQSAGGTLIERRLVDWTASRIGFGDAADGVFTSGGTQSNLQALLLAREESKTADLAKLRIFTSECSHFSVQKSAKLLGLGRDAVIALPTDRDRRMRTLALAAELERCRADGLVPMAIVATAGTTDFGSIDPLPEIAELAQQYGAWMHVDAAYGCGLLASPTRRHLLDGIEHADSVTVDYHKSFFQPVSSSAVLVKDGATLRHATYHADYLNPRRTVEERIPNQVDKSLQTTRRFDALKLWMTLRVMGADGIGGLFDEVCDLAAAGWELLAADPRYDVVVQPQLSTLVYRWIPPNVTSPAAIDRANLYARKALFASGEAVVAGTKVDGRQYLKFTLLNPETTTDDIAAVLDLIAGHAEQYLGENLVHAS
ncbi:MULTISPECIES: pyridoxal phosphate-dependent decarboxylase family protein [Streptomyces]|uniref:Aminotransferase class V-fold PLP-dependent enzyme n=1 Tax=Streptomyces tsukubensis (strain DSM 42081 / NBRC 108919 / NRRL 18488 / 9993) TaxID=1114943 RepID=I2MYM0_STRT9|nr:MULTISPECIES: aspartate aminotransferase family protein [Streptomyces]AZK94169.1 pyridoxal-dependent decarboxylase [Streptomyces tsukubensis]EIF89867.1 siderophore biosynthesis pyridoxal-dependent decarboxylase DesA [Streptomyces tsukubensis NRRL18488]MYS65194.1 aminotransferase class V-fold PLP-dependent enzyme [Streptomyces sp. SID5473]QKM69728.1 aminotransferase class V-fold PLP-dependent enzyme [Streptomyces tsukubensis NRRL18488]TAI46308.1 aminotransferase class V-fold PLP-dependent en